MYLKVVLSIYAFVVIIVDTPKRIDNIKILIYVLLVSILTKSSLNKLIISSNISCFHSISFYSRTAYLLIITSLCNSGWRWVTSLKAACFLYCGQRDFTSSPGSKPPMSSWVFALNSFVLPIQEVKRQSCSLAGSLP
jgi:hypothetical protein